MKAISRLPAELIVWIVSYAFFLFSLVSNFSASHDSIHYLNDIVQGTNLFHQHHLLYHFTAHYWLALMQKVFTGVPDYYLIEAFTAIWGSSSLALIYRFFVKRFGLPVLTAIAGTAVIGLSYGMWFYSVNIEVYAPPIFFILATLYIICSDDFSDRDIWKVALLHCLAILFHQVNILFAGVILVAIIGGKNVTNVPRALLLYILTGVVITTSAYFVAGWIIEQHNSFAAWIGWIEGYTVGHGYWQTLSWKTPLNVITGFAHAFVGGHYIFQLPLIKNYFRGSFESHGLNDEIYLSSNISVQLAWVLTILTIVFVLLLLLLVVRFFLNYKQIIMRRAKVVHPILLCLVIYSVFFCFWMPEILEFWILQMVLVWLLIIGMLPVIRFPFRIRGFAGPAILGVLLFVINFFGSIRWLEDIHKDWYFTRMEKVGRAATSSDLVLMEDGWILKDFLRYYTRATVMSPDDSGYSESLAERNLEQTISRNGRVYVYPGFINLRDGAGNTGFIDSILSRYSKRKRIFNERDPLIWVIE